MRTKEILRGESYFAYEYRELVFLREGNPNDNTLEKTIRL